jgi:acyl-CoA synthetase (AMP-forming)/AMP-acid ligase II
MNHVNASVHLAAPNNKTREETMFGLMMNVPLTIPSILAHAETFNSNGEIVSRKPEGGIHRYSYGEAAKRARRAAGAIRRLGVGFQDRVATLAWNTHRHFELYYGVSCSGVVLHIINPRLHPDQVAYILNHAEDRVLFVDLSFVPLAEAVFPKLTALKHIVVLTDREHMPQSSLPLLCYEELLAAESDSFDWPEIEENLAASLCYTSGTTGDPKGVLYSHRSTVLHAMAICNVDTMALSNRTVVLPVVPMFHVNAWGIPYGAALSGAKLVLPGGALDGKSLYELIEAEKADLLLGVPTVWLNLLNYCEKEGLRLNPVERLVIGGSAAPHSMIKAFQERHGAFVVHAWGMTEMSPLGTTNSPSRYSEILPLEDRYNLQTKQGRPLYGVQMRIAGPNGEVLPHDGRTSGRLEVRGPWIASAYYKETAQSAAWRDGWFDTGDIATIDENGFLNIVDRAKDIIKSGGEWISSVDVENFAMSHPAIAQCAVVGLEHPQWGERPLLVAVLKPGAAATQEDVLAFLGDRVMKWWLPDRVLFVDALPHTATGKILKRQLREDFRDLYEPQGDGAAMP